MVRRRSRSPRVYTEGELNRLVDAFIHPLFKRHPELLLLDGVIHGVIERNPSGSTTKFIQYNLPKLVLQLTSKQKANKERARRSQ